MFNVGELRIDLLNVPPYFGKPFGWKRKDFLKKCDDRKDDLPSLFNSSSLRGWWPLKSEDPDVTDVVCGI